jgi:hypothetical protein
LLNETQNTGGSRGELWRLQPRNGEMKIFQGSLLAAVANRENPTDATMPARRQRLERIRIKDALQNLSRLQE